MTEWAHTVVRRRVLNRLAARDAALRRSKKELTTAVKQARDLGASWQMIGLMVGISGEGARRKYGK